MKRFAAIPLMMAVLAGLLCAPAHAAERPGGDVDGNGIVTASDAAMALRASYGLIKLDNASAILSDVTGNLTVGGTDAQAILMLQTGWINAFSELIEIPADSLLGESGFEQFSYSGTRMLENAYLSSRVAVRTVEQRFLSSSCIVADIYIHNIESFSAGFSGGEYSRRDSLEAVPDIAAACGALLAVNGDFYSQRSVGPTVRNGVWYRDTLDTRSDLCVLYRDGRMETIAAGKADVAALKSGDVWQTWLYGPKLLDDSGAPAKYFNATQAQARRSARTAVGYYSPGHYCFIIVEGKKAGSEGMNLPELAEFCRSLGLKAAYNLTGGESTLMVLSGRILGSTPDDDGRTISDILYIAEPQTGGGA